MEKASDLDALRRGDLAGASRLRLPGLAELPREVFALADTLEILDIGGGALTSLPADMGRLGRLRILFASGNRFEVLPPSLGDCRSLSQIGFRANRLREIPGEALPPKLRWLILTQNEIERLPQALGARPLLQKLMLAGNRLVELPRGLAEAPALELIRLSANRFETIPLFLADLPALAWISWSGNPAERALAPAAAAPARWADLQISERLGGGASGDVHRALWRADAPRPVAVKLFRGAMTSDGAPESEMAACLAAGAHPNLVGALGRLEGHPEGRRGLLTPLLPAEWRALAAPPDFATCSRDVYDEALRLAPSAALRLAGGIASAAAHLHARGILHGDLYAHNILWDGRDGEAALSDFGAACALPEGEAGERWTRIETRAFGLLLDELAQRCEGSTQSETLRALARDCAQKIAAARPSMADAAAALGEA
jgi:hypothetical protein